LGVKKAFGGKNAMGGKKAKRKPCKSPLKKYNLLSKHHCKKTISL
jgi:hypothetical protein